MMGSGCGTAGIGAGPTISPTQRRPVKRWPGGQPHRPLGNAISGGRHAARTGSTATFTHETGSFADGSASPAGSPLDTARPAPSTTPGAVAATQLRNVPDASAGKRTVIVWVVASPSASETLASHENGKRVGAVPHGNGGEIETMSARAASASPPSVMTSESATVPLNAATPLLAIVTSNAQVSPARHVSGPLLATVISTPPVTHASLRSCTSLEPEIMPLAQFL